MKNSLKTPLENFRVSSQRTVRVGAQKTAGGKVNKYIHICVCNLYKACKDMRVGCVEQQELVKSRWKCAAARKLEHNWQCRCVACGMWHAVDSNEVAKNYTHTSTSVALHGSLAAATTRLRLLQKTRHTTDLVSCSWSLRNLVLKYYSESTFIHLQSVHMWLLHAELSHWLNIHSHSPRVHKLFLLLYAYFIFVYHFRINFRQLCAFGITM